MICRVCDSKDLITVLDLGEQPWCNNFLTESEVGNEPKYPLTLVYCKDCSCVQLNYTVPKEIMFADHTYVSGTTKTLAEHFYNTAKEIDSVFYKEVTEKSILDIGSNDGTQLLQYQKLGYHCLGVESCKAIADTAIENGIDTVAEFFNEECVSKINRKFDIINASGVFFHLEELHSATKAVKLALKEKGVFQVQFLYMKSIVENLAFDQIYHEHLLYYTFETFQTLMERHGLELFDAYISPIHGGSAICYVGHKGEREKTDRLLKLIAEENESKVNGLESYQDFAKRVYQMREDTVSYLEKAKSEGKTVFGFGAPVKGNTFLNFCNIGTQHLDCLVEKNPLRKGLYSPGMHIPIVMEDEIKDPPDIYFVLAWNFRKEILANNKDLIESGVEFYFPVVPKEIC